MHFRGKISLLTTLGALVASLGLVSAAPGAAQPDDGAAQRNDGGKYVALGSSFAAGPGLGDHAPNSPPYCTRSQHNYPHQVGQRLGMALTDATCSGATTDEILTKGQYGQPPQIEAVTADTELVTITIGGNDVQYLRSLISHSCQNNPAAVPEPWKQRGVCEPVDPAAIERDLAAVQGRMERVVEAVQAKAPQARVLLVDYLTIVPPWGLCSSIPLTDEQAGFDRKIARTLRAATATAAHRTDAGWVPMSLVSMGRDACSGDPWVTGFAYGELTPEGQVPYHPTEAGMRATADQVLRQVN